MRQVLFLRPGTVAIVDHLAAPPGKSLPEVAWLLHVPGRPEVGEQGVTVRNTKSYLRCRALHPGGRPQVEDSHRTAAGPVSSQGNPAVIDASRVVFAYAGQPRLVLVHLLEVGDGQPATAAPIRVEAGANGVSLLLNGKRCRFSAPSPFEVSVEGP